MPDRDRQIVVFADVRSEQAYLLRNRLLESGIEAMVTNDSLQVASGELPLGWPLARQVVVAQRDIRAAEAIVAEFLREMQSPESADDGDRGMQGMADTDDEEADDEEDEDVDNVTPRGWSASHIVATGRRAATARDADQDASDATGDVDEVATSACPDCGHPRLAVCPFCQTASSHFPAGEVPMDAADDEAPPILVCTTCDEPFRAAFLRRCEWCGHDFGSGIAPRPAAAPPVLNDRVIAVVVGLVVVLLGLFGYFKFLLR